MLTGMRVCVLVAVLSFANAQESTDTREHYHGAGQLLINDQHKLLACYIQKNGCTVMAQLMMHAAGRPVSGGLVAVSMHDTN